MKSKKILKIISIVLVFAVLLSSYVMQSVVAVDEITIWDGTIAESYASGSGTDKDPYIISNGAQLARAINLFGEDGKYYKLDRDIYLNDIANFSSPANSWFAGDADALGYYAYTGTVTDSGKTAVTGVFNGHIDGDGNHVYGLAYKGDGSHISGLIPLMAAGSVKNLGIDNFKLRAGSYNQGGGPCVGVIIGRTKQTGMIYVDRCYVGENASINLASSGTRGGIIGYATANTADAYVAISNSYVLVSSEYFKYWSSTKCNALIAEAWDTYYTIENSWSISRPLNTGGSEHRVSWFYKSDTSKMGDYLKNVFSLEYAPSGAYEVVGDAKAFTQLNEAQMKGPDVFDYMTINGDGAFSHNNGYPTLKIFDPTDVNVEEEEVGEVWNGTVAMSYASGSGTQNDPYIISKGSQLARAINSFGENGAYFKLDRDIYLNDIEDLSNATNSWFSGLVSAKGYYSYSGTVTEDKKTAKTGAFNGHIDGNGYHVYGLKYTDDTSSQASGLIPIMAEGSIKNLGLNHVKLRTGSYSGGEGASEGAFIGRTYQTGMIEIDRCYLGSTASYYVGSTGNRGGFIAYATTNTPSAYVAISNSYVLTDQFSGYGAQQSNAFIGMVWDTYYTLENVWSTGRPLGTLGNEHRVSWFYKTDTSKMGDYLKNVYGGGGYQPSGIYEVVGDAKAFTCLTEEQMKGKVTDGNNMVLGDAFMATDIYPVLKVFQKNSPIGWNGLAEDFTKGDGKTADTAYEISTVGQLAHAVALGSGNYYKLVNDIYINDVSKINWEDGTLLDENYIPTEWFSGTEKASQNYTGFISDSKWKGTLDGNGFTVYGLYYSGDFSYTTAGLIPGMEAATVKNLHLSKSYVVGGRFIGAITSAFEGTMEGVVADDTVTVVAKNNVEADSYSCAGLIGYSNGVTLKDCAFYGTLSTDIRDVHIYGLVGTSWGTKVHATDCYSLGYQPFTTAIGAKNYDTKADADANYQSFYSNLYKVTDVYTNVNTRTNKVTYKYDSDGIDTDGENGLEYDVSNTYEVFTFTQLTSEQMKGKTALDNMTGLSSDVWYATNSVPKTKLWATTNGDADLDGIRAVAGDYTAIRKAIIGAGETGCTDFDRNGTTDITDLVKVWNIVPTFTTGDFTYTLKRIGDIEDYTIVYAANDENAKAAAESLQKMYADKGITLSVSSDAAGSATAKEILIGNTNRGLHENGLPEGKYTIKVIGDSVQFSAAANLTDALKTAANTFMKFYTPYFAAETEGWHEAGFYEEGGSVTLATSIPKWPWENPSTKSFTYVWGDEFYGDTLNRNKWVCTTESSKMSSYSDLTILSTEEAVAVNGGSLKMTAGKRADGTYTAPASVHTQGTMEYRYGYVEMRAKVPYKVGIWPSFWMQSQAVLGGRQNYDYFTEIDMLEVFGHPDTLYSNVHKWYSGEKIAEYGKKSISAASNGGTSNWLEGLLQENNGTEKWQFSSNDEAIGWHTYGFGWDENYMYMYVDRELFKRYNLNDAESVFGETNATMDPDMSGFHDPLFLIFNNHVFTPGLVGSFETWDPTDITNNESNLPATYEIDYVRLYQASDADTRIWTK